MALRYINSHHRTHPSFKLPAPAYAQWSHRYCAKQKQLRENPISVSALQNAIRARSLRQKRRQNVEALEDNTAKTEEADGVNSIAIEEVICDDWIFVLSASNIKEKTSLKCGAALQNWTKLTATSTDNNSGVGSNDNDWIVVAGDF